MINTCLLRNNRTCSRKKIIKNFKNTNKLLIVYGFDWGTSTDTPAFVYELIMDEIKPEVNKHNMKLVFQSLGGKEGSIYCDICCMIQKADIAIFDISTNNYNVIFELGLAVASGVYIYIIRSRHMRQQEMISDLNGIMEYRFTRRRGPLQFNVDLKKRLISKIRTIVKNKI